MFVSLDQCADIDAMQAPYSRKVLAGLTGTKPEGKNASLLDLISGKSVSFIENGTIEIFVVFKSDLFVYLKSVGISSLSESNAKRIEIDYLDENQLLIRQTFINYSKEQTPIEPIAGVSSLKFTIIETVDGKPATNIRLSVRGCFGRQPSTTTTTTPSPPSISTTPGTPCHHLDLMSDRSVARQTIAFVAGTNPISSSIFDYFNTSTSVSYATVSATFLIIFKRNIYVELKSISITNSQTNVLKYQIDLIDHDQTILQSIVIDNSSTTNFDISIGALQITYLETTDGQPARNILLSIDGCFAINPEISEETTTTTSPPVTTMRKCESFIRPQVILLFPFSRLP